MKGQVVSEDWRQVVAEDVRCKEHGPYMGQGILIA